MDSLTSRPATRASVAVVIPCYRCKLTIERAVTSVLNQTVAVEEIILVDDASGDGTLDVLRSLRDSYSSYPINIIELPVNKGPGSARNIGWEAAKSSYVAFLDSDDSWHWRKVELQYGWMQLHPDCLMTGHPTAVVAQDGQMPMCHLPAIHARSVSKVEQLVANQFATRSVMIRRNAPRRFREHKKYAEDFLLWSQLALDDHKLVRLSPVLAFSYKEGFGSGGLTANMDAMLDGIRDSYRILLEEELINHVTYWYLHIWSSLKHMRRKLIARLRS